MRTKVLALLLSLIMCASTINISVYAQGSTESVVESVEEITTEEIITEEETTTEEKRDDVAEEVTELEEAVTVDETESTGEVVEAIAESEAETCETTEKETDPSETGSYEEAMAELANVPMLMSADGMETDEDANDGLLLYGDATRLGDKSIQLTPLATWKSGSAWYSHQIDATSGFETSFSYWAGGGRNDYYGGADGITLTFSKSPGIGSLGGQMGFVGKGAVGVELDSYPKNSNDPSGKHIAIVKDSSFNHLISKSDNRVDDSQWHTMKVTYESGNLKVYLDSDSKPVLEMDEVYVPDNFYLGISAATGSGVNCHLIKDFYVKCAKEDKEKNCPIVIVPGVLGSQLYAGEQKVWDPTDLGIIFDSEVDLGNYLNISNKLYVHNGKRDESGQLIPINQALLKEGEREYGAANTYDNLVDCIIDNFTDIGKCTRSVYFFSYDFRQPNVNSASLLDEYIDAVLKQNPEYSKVDIVAHSMGGLVTASYVKNYEEKVRKIVTAGTPYEGAPKLVNGVLTPEVLDSELGNLFLKLKGLTKEVKATFPALAELAPTEAYFNSHAGLFQKYSESDNIYRELSFEEYKKINSYIFNEVNAKNAIQFQNSIKNESDYNILADLDNSYFLVGINQKTISGIKYNEGTSLNSLEVTDVTYERAGDGTVPYDSAMMMNQLDSERVYKVTATHTGVIGADGEVGAEESLQYIMNVLSDKDIVSKSDKLNKKEYIVIRIACPVDVKVTKNGEVLSSDADNRNTTTSYGVLDFLGENAQIKTICLDYSDDYDIVLNGTGTGTMDYSIRYYNKDNELETEYVFTDVAITPQTVLTTGSDQNNIVLNLDRNSDGKVEQILEPGDYSGVGVMNRISDTSYLFSSDTIDVAYNIGSQYGNNYHVNMTITNKTDTTIHNWKLEYDSTDTIHSIWNGVVVDGQDYTLIKNVGYNQDILPGQAVSFGYIAVKGEEIKIPTYFCIISNSSSVNEKGYDVSFRIDSDWETGYNASITITNTSDAVISDWSLLFDYEESIGSIWEGVIVSNENGRYTIQNASYNHNINPGQSVTIGFTIPNRISKSGPTNFELIQVG